MLEGRSCLVSRTFPSSCEQESNKWTYMTYRVGVEVPNGKRRFELDPEEEEGLRKTLKVCDIEEKVTSSNLDMVSLPLVVPVSHADAQDDGGDQGDVSHADVQDDGGDQGDVSDADAQDDGGDQGDMNCYISPLNHHITTECLLHCSRADYGSIGSLNRSFRNFIKSGEIYRLRRKRGIIEHWVYFSCRLLEWVAFDPVTRRWMQLPRMNSNECFMCSDKESLAVGTELLVLGKDLMSHVIYRYSILTNSWSSGMSMNAPRCLFGSASLGEKAIFAGGCDSQGNILSSAELYDSETQTWVTLPSMLKPRKMCSGLFMDGKFYVLGGIGGGDGRVLTCGEEFDLQTRTWTEIPNMSPGNHAAPQNDLPAPAEAPPLIAVVNNQLYAADYAAMIVKRYNKETRAWVTEGGLPERAGSMNGWGLAFRACGDRVIVIGGPRGHGEGFVEVNSWKPSEGPPVWQLLDRKQSGSFVYNCAVMGC